MFFPDFILFQYYVLLYSHEFCILIANILHDDSYQWTAVECGLNMLQVGKLDIICEEP